MIIDDLKQQRQTNKDMIIYNKKMIEKEKIILSDAEKFFINEKNNIQWRSFDYHTLQGWQHEEGYYYMNFMDGYEQTFTTLQADVGIEHWPIGWISNKEYNIEHSR